jgi:hypothetical protein
VVQQAFNPGDAVITPIVDSSLTSIRAYAAKRSSGYGLLLVNVDENNPVSATIKLLNESRTFTASSMVYGRAQYDDAQHNVWTPPISQSLGSVSASLSVTLPQWSITAITLR